MNHTNNNYVVSDGDIAPRFQVYSRRCRARYHCGSNRECGLDSDWTSYL